MTDGSYHAIIAHYEDCLREHGDGPRAVDWKSARDAAVRYDVMLGMVRDRAAPATLLDFGCGLGALRGHMAGSGLSGINYTGLDASAAFAAAARERNPGVEFLCLDVLSDGAALPSYDYIVMNGIFTRRHDLTVEAMDAYLRRLLPVVFRSCRVGLAFNVMSKAVDWEGDALYHPDPGALLDFISRALTRHCVVFTSRAVTRHCVVRNDYGLHETTCYLFRAPQAHGGAALETTA